MIKYGVLSNLINDSLLEAVLAIGFRKHLLMNGGTAILYLTGFLELNTKNYLQYICIFENGYL